MPDMPFEVPDDTPLFGDDDPLTITIPGGSTYRCLDRANPPIEDEVNPETKPVSYMVEVLRLQVVEDQRDGFVAEITDALRENRVMYGELVKVARWLTEQRKAAEKGTVARVVKRPTRARPRSTH